MAELIHIHEDQEILQGFVDESREMLDEVEPLLIELEERSSHSCRVDPEVLNTIFRLFHSMKGSAGFLELMTLGKVTHTAETILDLFRKRSGTIDSNHIDILNRICDFIRVLLDQIVEKYHDEGYEEEAKDIVCALKPTIDDLEETKTATAVDSRIIGPIKIGENTISNIKKQPVADQFDYQTPIIVSITSEMAKQFIAEAEEHLEFGEDALLELEKEPENEELVSLAIQAFHSFKDKSCSMGYGDLEKLSHRVEYVLECVKDGEVQDSRNIFSLLLEIIDFLRGGVTQIAKGKPPKISGINGLVNLIEDSISTNNDEIDESSNVISESVGESPEIVGVLPLKTGCAKSDMGCDITQAELLQEQSTQNRRKFVDRRSKHSIRSDKDRVTEQAELLQEQSTQNRRIFVDRRSNCSIKSDKDRYTEQATQNRRKFIDRRSKYGRRTNDSRISDLIVKQRQSLRVDIKKLDRLLDIVGELVIAEARVVQNPDLKEYRDKLENFEKSARQLDKITRDLQDIATSIRMIPLSGTFRRMIRLVRDLAHKADKKAELKLIGEDSEVDKNIIEHINNPIVHAIRNSIDHGIATPEERLAVNKSEIGKITLEAKYVGGEVWVIVSDDGRGLRRDKILSKAIDRGLINGNGSELKDEEVWQFIFHPGFSTAERLTEISGRGVGMDVVRRNIESIRGKVEVWSREGEGTEVTLRIPLTLATIEGMIIRVEDALYTIPISMVKESLQPTNDQITEVLDCQEIVRIRGQLISVVRLHEFYGITSNEKELRDGILVVVENDDKLLCLFVDEVIGQRQVVIKGLPEFIGTLNGISGCTILGDGRDCPIIDVPGIFKQSELSEA